MHSDPTAQKLQSERVGSLVRWIRNLQIGSEGVVARKWHPNRLDQATQRRCCCRISPKDAVSGGISIKFDVVFDFSFFGKRKCPWG